MTTGTTDHPGGYEGAITEFYDASAQRLAAHLSQGRDVVVLCEGDPLFYGSYMYLHDRLASRFPTEIVPGVTSISAASAAAACPLVRRTDVLTILPGTLPPPELARRLADTDAAAVLKLGRRTFAGVREALAQAGRLEDAVYVERASMAEQRILPVGDVASDDVPYFSLILKVILLLFLEGFHSLLVSVVKTNTIIFPIISVISSKFVLFHSEYMLMSVITISEYKGNGNFAQNVIELKSFFII